MKKKSLFSSLIPHPSSLQKERAPGVGHGSQKFRDNPGTLAGASIVGESDRRVQGKKRASTLGRLRGEHGRHAPAFHRRGLLDLGDVGQLLENAVDDPAALLNVLQL